MCNKKFFRTLNEAKCAKCVFVISGIFLIIGLFSMIGTVPAEESAQVSSASDELDQKVRIILQNSINTIRNARSYSTYLRCQAIILGKTVNGEGEYYQKRQNSSLKGQETVSARWEMTLKLLPNSRFYQLMILNGEQDRLWMLTERRTG